MKLTNVSKTNKLDISLFKLTLAPKASAHVSVKPGYRTALVTLLQSKCVVATASAAEITLIGGDAHRLIKSGFLLSEGAAPADIKEEAPADIKEEAPADIKEEAPSKPVTKSKAKAK